MFKAQQQVVVRDKHLHGNISELRPGTVVSATQDRVSVAFPGEDFPRSFPVDKVSMAEKYMGYGLNVENPYDQPVVKMYPRSMS